MAETGEKKGFLKRILDSLDKKLEEKAKSSCSCCSGQSKRDDDSVCSQE